MALTTRLISPSRFSPGPVSVLTLILFAVIFGAVLVTDQTPGIPTKQNGLSLQQAYHDLHEITARPHPYISHANDDVRAFLLSRIKPIVDSRSYIHISDDMSSNASWASGSGAFYFEGTNILVKIDGTDSPAINSNGVLFSAHYDSVSTAPGATDDGMSTVTLLQMLEYLSVPKRRPRRTAVFFFNNGEEDGLNGAHVLFEHPWANLTTTFINLEGAAAGGRPILFRSSLATARAFNSKSVPHPHGNALSADAFSRGVIRSGTDYSVYAQGIPGEKKGMGGVDLAFYKNRAFYHTAFDSIPGMGRDEGRKSLWAMMETTQGVGLQLLNGADAEDTSAGVYFDLLGRKMVTVSLRGLFITHIVFLILGPLIVLGLLAWVLILTKDTYADAHVIASEELTLWHRFRLVLAKVMGWGRFWFTLLITISVNIALVTGYVKINRYVVYSKQYVVLATFLTASFLSYTLSLSLFYKIWPSPPASQKFAILLETYFLSWIFLVIGTVGVNKFQLGGVYLSTAWNLSAWLAVTLALVEAVLRARWTVQHGGKPDLDIVQEEEPRENTPPGHHFVRGVAYQPPVQHVESQETHDETEPVETEPTEITPLMQQHRRRSTGGREYIVGVDGEPLLVNGYPKKEAAQDEYGWWILQILALIPLPTMLLFQTMVLIAHALRNTLADGSSPINVYGSMAVLSLLIFVNIAPFAHRIDRTLYLSVLVIFIITLVYSWTAFPFAQEAPLKLFFQQSIEVDGSGLSSSLSSSLNLSTSPGPLNQAALSPPIIRAETFLTGIPDYIDKKIVRELPSSWNKDVVCETDTVLRPGLRTCKWDSGLLLPSPGGNAPPGSQAASKWITFDSERLNTSAGRISIKGTNTRGCALYFDTPITSYTVAGGGRFQPGYEIPASGIKKLQMWSREWDKEFNVEFAWAGGSTDFKMTGRAACEWAEYASGTAGSPHAAESAQIPALEEVLHFLPLWATPTKWSVGLVEAWTKFSI
ncbi:hypothetical protein PHLGIDRAFT_126626 [Phlebiopsis gigantea 11061_1 CR5-6]|uniref:Peptide hydrolase n=1 Tax=Phlebiopsis gigantea (strain 11061_1 CR5-6) TaxID=745531 RepID=A0A0C3SAA1_PHLG1|nr:hypothetical protein PHLGIDRAFT_126626 [Phlebiopsis gigantea 11061_1 CR5-6]